jgi:hypothetical protein
VGSPRMPGAFPTPAPWAWILADLFQRDHAVGFPGPTAVARHCSPRSGGAASAELELGSVLLHDGTDEAAAGRRGDEPHDVRPAMRTGARLQAWL